MQERKSIQDYLETVAEQIRWKRARPVVTSELKRHLEDQRDAFAADGFENAEELAVEEMGDPVAVGVELDRIHRPKPQWDLLAFTVLFALAGAVLRIWLTADWGAYHMNIDPVRTILAFFLGCGALLAGYFLDYSFLVRHAEKVYAGILVVSVLMLRFSPNVNGAFVYVRYVICCYPVIYAFWVYACRGKGWTGVLAAVAGGVPLTVVCWAAPYVLGLILLLLTGFVLLLYACLKDWFGIGRWKSALVPLGAAAAVVGTVIYAVFHLGYPVQRFTAVIHPEQDPLGLGYQAISIREALGVSRWLGEGSWAATGFPYPYEMTVPGCDSDSLLTTLVYKMGWLPFVVVILAFAGLMAWLVSRCLRQKSQLGRLVVIAVVMSFSLQALASIVWNMGFTFFSASFPLIIGNLNTVLNMGLIGLALSVFRGESIARDPVCEGRHFSCYRVKIIIQKV